MPIEIPNKQSFRPFYPRAPRPHSLFGKTYVHHQFQSLKWVRTSQNEQYHGMNRFLSKHLELKRLEEQLRMSNAKKNLKILRTKCQEARKEIKLATQGDIRRVRNILMEHKEMQRLYQHQHIILANNNIQRRNFVKRKENDRLKYKLNILSAKYKELLCEQSRLTDNIKYEKEYFTDPCDIQAIKLRPILDNSKTRIRVFKMINQCYQNMIHTLQVDESHYHPVLDSLEADLSEQSKFIQHVILLTLPARKKYQEMIDDYNNMEAQTRYEIKRNIKFLTDTKQGVQKREEEVKDIVAKKIESFYPQRNYCRDTVSMSKLHDEKEDLYKIIKTLQLATVSAIHEEVIERMESCDKTNIDTIEQLHRCEKQFLILGETENQAKAMLDSLKYTDMDDDKNITINNIKEEIREEKNVHKQCDEAINQSGEMLILLRKALLNLLEIMRHVGKDRKRLIRTYPNDILKLPLLQFDFVPEKAPPVPPEYDENDDKLIELAKEKIRELIWAGKPHIKNRRAEKIYASAYLETLGKPNIIGDIAKEDDSAMNWTKAKDCQDPNILCRSTIKEISAKIVETERIKKELNN